MQPTVRLNNNGVEHTQQSLVNFKDFKGLCLLVKKEKYLQESLSVQVNLNRESKEGLLLNER